MSNKNVRLYLAQMVELRARIHEQNGGKFAGWRYQSIEALILDLATPFQRVPKPRGSGVRMGRMKHCFTNATRAVWQRPELTYVEGYAYSIFPCMHAWVTADGSKAWDVTWPDDDRHGNAEYLGIMWSKAYLNKAAAQTGFYGVLGSGDDDLIAKLLREGPPPGAIQGRA